MEAYAVNTRVLADKLQTTNLNKRHGCIKKICPGDPPKYIVQLDTMPSALSKLAHKNLVPEKSFPAQYQALYSPDGVLPSNHDNAVNFLIRGISSTSISADDVRALCTYVDTECSQQGISSETYFDSNQICLLAAKNAIESPFAAGGWGTNVREQFYVFPDTNSQAIYLIPTFQIDGKPCMVYKVLHFSNGIVPTIEKDRSLDGQPFLVETTLVPWYGHLVALNTRVQCKVDGSGNEIEKCFFELDVESVEGQSYKECLAAAIDNGTVITHFRDEELAVAVNHELQSSVQSPSLAEQALVSRLSNVKQQVPEDVSNMDQLEESSWTLCFTKETNGNDVIHSIHLREGKNQFTSAHVKLVNKDPIAEDALHVVVDCAENGKIAPFVLSIDDKVIATRVQGLLEPLNIHVEYFPPLERWKISCPKTSKGKLKVAVDDDSADGTGFGGSVAANADNDFGMAKKKRTKKKKPKAEVEVEEGEEDSWLSKDYPDLSNVEKHAV